MSNDRAKIPTQEEIAELPRWAQVAFAARCARRVQLLYKQLWPDASQEQVEAIDCAITRAIASAATPASVSEQELRAAADAAADASAAVNVAADAANSAMAAASAAYAADYATASNAFFAAAYVADAAVAADTDADAVRRDFDLLLELSKREQWTDDTPVPQEAFGPMWTEGWLKNLVAGEVQPKSDGSPTPWRTITEPRIVLAWDPGVLSNDEYVELVSILGDLVRENGGVGVRRISADGKYVSCSEGASL